MVSHIGPAVVDPARLRESERQFAFGRFLGVSGRRGEKSSLAYIVSAIESGVGIQRHTDSVRQERAGSTVWREKKKIGESVSWAGTFPGVRRAAGPDPSDWQPTGLVFVDVDPVDKTSAGMTDGYGLLARFRGHPHVLLGYPSVSGTGCHVIYRVDPVPDYGDYRHAWAACKADAERRIGTGISVDSTPDANRLAFLAHYPEIGEMLNLDAEPLSWTAPVFAPVPSQQPRRMGSGTDDWVALINGARYDHRSYSDWTVVGLALRHSQDDGMLGDADGWQIWADWSAQDGGNFWDGAYDPTARWDEYGRSERTGRDRVTAATLVYRAKESGYGGTYPQSVPAPYDDTGGKIKLDKAGVEVALRYLGVKVRINERAHLFEFATDDVWLLSQTTRRGKPGKWIPLEDTADAAIRAAVEKSFQVQEGKPARFSKDRWFDCLRAYCAGLREIDPLEEWLGELPAWDGVERIDTLLIDLLKAPDTELNRFVSGAILCGAISRTYEPGCEHDWIPVLIGGQGVGKSSFIRGLIPPDMQSVWYSDGAELDASRKELFESIQGAVLVEFSELKGVHHTKIEMLKSTISRATDRLRLPYGTSATTIARRWVGVGTANNDGTGILPNDATGNRRFVAVDVRATKDDAYHVREYLDQHREQLWAEALTRYLEAEGSEGKRALHMVGRYGAAADSVNASFERISDGMAGDAAWLTEQYAGTPEGEQGLELARMLVELGLFDSEPAAKKDRSLQTLLSLELTRLRWTKRQKRSGYSRLMLWSPPAPAAEPPSRPPRTEPVPMPQTDCQLCGLLWPIDQLTADADYTRYCPDCWAEIKR